jgi:H/ACA ribonucleoprotein complex subunit 3
MKTGFKKCERCGVYTLKDRCPSCNGHVTNPVPSKFSIQDRFGKYRRMMKKEKI